MSESKKKNIPETVNFYFKASGAVTEFLNALLGFNRCENANNGIIVSTQVYYNSFLRSMLTLGLVFFFHKLVAGGRRGMGLPPVRVHLSDATPG